MHDTNGNSMVIVETILDIWFNGSVWASCSLTPTVVTVSSGLTVLDEVYFVQSGTRLYPLTLVELDLLDSTVVSDY